MIPPDLRDFLHGDHSILVGTADAALRPECVRAVGLCVSEDGATVRVHVPSAPGDVTRENLRTNPRIAIAVSHPGTHRSVQLKGDAVAVKDATADDLAAAEGYRAGLARALDRVGLPVRLGLRLACEPAYVVEVRVREIFDQTPGPGAGERLRGGR